MDIIQAIGHGETEIALVKRALQIGSPISPIDHKHLASKLVRLGELYELNGDTDKATQAFAETKAVVKKRMINEGLINDDQQ